MTLDFASTDYVYPGNIGLSRPNLTADTTCDIAIVGAGLFGLTTALRLAETGLRVIVIEARHVGYGASSRNGGQCLTGWRWGQSDLAKRFGNDAAARLFEIALAGRDDVKQRAQRLGIWSTGSMTIADKRAHESKLRQALAYEQEQYGYTDADWLSHDEAAAITGSPAGYGGVRDRGAGFIDSPAYLKGLAREAEEMGAEIREATPVQSIESEANGGIKLVTPHASVRAQQIVIACNGYIGNLVPKLRRRIFPFTAVNGVTKPIPDAALPALLPFWEAGHCVTGTNFSVNYFRPLPNTASGHRLGFGGGEIWRRQGTKITDATRVLTRNFRYQYPHVAELLGDSMFEHVWSGQIGVTPNRLPAVGTLDKRTHYALGFSGLGIAITNAVASVVGRHIATHFGEAPQHERVSEDFDLLASLSRKRFPPWRWTVELGARIYIAQDHIGT